MHRREFVVQSGLLGSLGLTVPSLLSQKPKKPKSVIVIGAGFAGLAAAYRLKKKGIAVTVLESRNRPGGRVLSHKVDTQNPLVIELGAEWVGNSHERVIQLCADFGLELQNNQFESHLTLQGQHQAPGQWDFSPAFNAFWKDKTEIWNKLTPVQRRKLDKMDWWRYLANRSFDDRDLLLRDLLDSTDFGESIRHTSAFAAFAEYAESSEKNEMDLKIKGGNSQLTEKLAQAVGPDHIFLQHHVRQIDQSKASTVSVECTNGKSFSADAVVCTLPTWSLLKIKWNPVLPSAYIDAVHALQYARIGKFPMVFSERFWKEENFDMVTDTPAHYFYHATKNQNQKEGVLICYAIGEKADVLNSVTDLQREEIILQALKPAFGEVRNQLINSLKYYWGVDAYSKGAYAFYGKSQWFGIMPQLKIPHQRVHFAGEHLADWQGFMEGAIVTGEEAADAIVGK